ncbi:hypothetical protein TWF281_000816 [Arthrobotrys megalospora]
MLPQPSALFILTTIITTFLLNIKIVSSQSTAENEFIFPPPYDPTNDSYEDNPVYIAGDRITIKWRTNYDSFKLFSMQGSATVSYSEDLKLESNATSSPHATSYSWEVWTNIEDPPYLPLYLIIFNSKDESQSFRSRSFNITNGKAPDGIAYTATERDPSVRTFTSSKEVAVETATATFTTVVSHTAEVTGTPTSSTFEAEDTATEDMGGDKNRALKLGLGIGLGLGLGIPILAALVLFFCGFLICRAVALDYNPRDGNDEVVVEGRSPPLSPNIGGNQDVEKV